MWYLPKNDLCFVIGLTVYIISPSIISAYFHLSTNKQLDLNEK